MGGFCNKGGFADSTKGTDASASVGIVGGFCEVVERCAENEPEDLKADPEIDGVLGFP